MTKHRRGNKENKKRPALTLVEKRAVKRTKKEDAALLGKDGVVRTLAIPGANKRGRT